jgi:hypothetical protein
VKIQDIATAAQSLANYCYREGEAADLRIIDGAVKQLRDSLYKGVKDLDYTVGHMGTTSEENAIYLLNEAAAEHCADCKAAKRHAYSDATTPGFFNNRCVKHQGRIGTTPEEIAAKHEQQQKNAGQQWDCGCHHCVKMRSFKLVNDRRINPKGVRGQ